MKLKTTILTGYLVMGVVVCLWFSVAAANGWRAPDLGIVNGSGSGSGRSFGGSWGGGK